jgi:hypothetical protein
MGPTKLNRQRVVLTLLALFSSLGLAATPMGTVFIYQGRLTAGGNLANGTYDLQFALYDDGGGGGTAVSRLITNSPLGVTNGHVCFFLTCIKPTQLVINSVRVHFPVVRGAP